MPKELAKETQAMNPKPNTKHPQVESAKHRSNTEPLRKKEKEKKKKGQPSIMGKVRRRWEDLERDCLVNVFRRVGMESLLFDVPFVCKSWFTATLDPSCWQYLIFPDIPSDLADRLDNIFSFIYPSDSIELYPDHFDPLIRRYIGAYRFGSSHVSITAFVEFVLRRSNGNVVFLKVPRHCPKAALKSVAHACPDLKALALPRDALNSDVVPELVGSLTSLRSLLLLGSCNYIERFLLPISKYCKKFRGLCFYEAYITEEAASAIVNSLPNIKYLILRSTLIRPDGLITLLRGCKQLVLLHLSECPCFRVNDEILNLASRISDFRFSNHFGGFQGYYVDDELGYINFDEGTSDDDYD
ncbi:F-box protein FBW2-like [Rosa rugosa]|uniref:F-box protein FBW2-like n=1 Tax=Rosa rugosa TaxID=74645 RepID=UPI002B416A92|nr:F-box protein FBW2-like [Rosa rugosa]